MKNLCVVKTYYVYIVTNKRNTVFYTGVTNNLERRMWEHKDKKTPGFTAKYNINKLIYYEIFSNPEDAITAEKKIKGWTRAKKLRLVQEMNPTLTDLTRDSSLCSE
ncbi:MAG: GIY-YIG nuclease family protein [Patescibacteria group bacterium]